MPQVHHTRTVVHPGCRASLMAYARRSKVSRGAWSIVTPAWCFATLGSYRRGPIHPMTYRVGVVAICKGGDREQVECHRHHPPCDSQPEPSIFQHIAPSWYRRKGHRRQSPFPVFSLVSPTPICLTTPCGPLFTRRSPCAKIQTSRHFPL